MKLKGLLMRIFTIVMGAVAFIGLAVEFIGVKISLLGKTNVSGSKFADWNEMLSTLKANGVNAESAEATRILAIITLVLVGLVVVGAVLKFLFNAKLVNNCVLLTSSLTILSGIATAIALITFTSKNATDLVKLVPMAGAYLLIIGAILAGIFGIILGLEKAAKAKKKRR